MNLQIKKQWLLSSILYFTFLLVDGFLIDPYLSFRFEFISFIFLIPFGYLFLESLNFTALFWFSYKRNGTILLTLNMILNLLRMYVAVVLPIQFSKEISSHVTTNKLAFIAVFYFFIFLQWFYFSFKLRRVNKLVTKNEILSHPEYQKSIQALQSANNLDELSLRYSVSVQSHPQIAGALKKVYEQKRKIL